MLSWFSQTVQLVLVKRVVPAHSTSILADRYTTSSTSHSQYNAHTHSTPVAAGACQVCCACPLVKHTSRPKIPDKQTKHKTHLQCAHTYTQAQHTCRCWCLSSVLRLSTRQAHRGHLHSPSGTSSNGGVAQKQWNSSSQPSHKMRCEGSSLQMNRVCLRVCRQVCACVCIFVCAHHVCPYMHVLTCVCLRVYLCMCVCAGLVCLYMHVLILEHAHNSRKEEAFVCVSFCMDGGLLVHISDHEYMVR